MAVDDLYRITPKGDRYHLDMVAGRIPDTFGSFVDFELLDTFYEDQPTSYSDMVNWLLGEEWEGARVVDRKALTEQDIRSSLRRLFEAGYLEKVD